MQVPTTSPKYDAIICVGPQHIAIAKTVIQRLKLFFHPQHIYVITNESHFKDFQLLIPELDLILVNENDLFERFNLQSVANYLEERINKKERAGWYFQQFLKMEIVKIIQNEYYLIWDADTVPLKPIRFFNNENRVLIHKSEENHPPYFETLKRILGLSKAVDYSFISEHLMVRTSLMRTMLLKLRADDDDRAWPYHILENIKTEDLPLSGFSEYETYGNFLRSTDPESFALRTDPAEILYSSRNGSTFFSSSPQPKDLDFLAALGLHYVTFETWQDSNSRKVRANRKRSRLFLFFKNAPLLNIISRQIKKNFMKTYSLPRQP